MQSQQSQPQQPHPPQPQPQQSITILEYRNGIYQGQVKNNKRNGYGILITDDNLIIASEWKNDVMSGRGLVFIHPQHYGYGDFNRGDIEGMFLWRGKGKTLFSEFNISRPINKMVLIDYDTQKIQTLIHKTPIFQIQTQKQIPPQFSQLPYLQSTTPNPFPCLPLLQYLQQQLCKSSNTKFELKSLPNNNILLYFNDPKNPISIGLCFNKNQQLVSCGMYVGDKLNGLGCKYQNAVRYQGMFQGGFVNGVGLKFTQGKYSFGQYEAGNLVEALYIDDRSNISQEKLQEFKKLYHLKSMWYQNSYIRRNLLKFRGLEQLVFQINSQQQYMYPQISTFLQTPRKPQSINPNQSSLSQQNQMIYQSNRLPQQQLQRTNSKNINLYNSNNIKNNEGLFMNSSNNFGKNLNPSPSKNLALNMLMKREGDKLETKSSKEYIGRLHFGGVNDSGVRNQGSMVGGYNNVNTKTTIQRGKDGVYKNPEDQDDLMLMEDGRSSTALRNLRKFKS